MDYKHGGNFGEINALSSFRAWASFQCMWYIVQWKVRACVGSYLIAESGWRLRGWASSGARQAHIFYTRFPQIIKQMLTELYTSTRAAPQRAQCDDW